MTSIKWRKNKKYCFTLLFALQHLFISACQMVPLIGVGNNTSGITSSQNIDPSVLAQFDIDQLTHQAIEHLLDGKEGLAKIYLETILERKPDHPPAMLLLDQITGDVYRYTGDISYGYKIQEKDSILALAKRYLGDELKFYALARFNQIDNPRQLTPGQWIKLPKNKIMLSNNRAKKTENLHKTESTHGTETQILPNVDLNPLPQTQPQSALEKTAILEQKVEGLVRQGQLSDIINLHKKDPTAFSLSPQLENHLANSYLTLATKAWDKDDIAYTDRLLQDTENIHVSIDIEDKLNELQKKVDAEKLYRDGLLLKNKKHWRDSLASFTQALILQPKHTNAAKEKKAVKAILINQRFREALAAREQRDYHKEHNLLGQVLELNPSHASAWRRQQQVKELIKRIENIDL